ncbi:hypothetical protein D7Z54_34645, partial [Salibacterium salarium]
MPKITMGEMSVEGTVEELREMGYIEEEAEPAPTLNELVDGITEDNRHYPDEGAPQVGDYAEVVSLSDCMAGFKIDGVVEISGFGAGHTYRLSPITEMDATVGFGNAEHLRKIPTVEHVTHEGITYREVNRQAEVGEKIRIVAEESPSGAYENGDVLTVRKSHRKGVHMRELSPGWISAYHREYTVLEPLTAQGQPAADDVITHKGATYRKVWRKARVGDVVGYKGGMYNGFITEVVRVDDGTLRGNNKYGIPDFKIYGIEKPAAVYEPVDCCAKETDAPDTITAK